VKLCGRFDGPVLGFAVTQFFWGCCGSRLAYGIIALCILGSLMFYSGESSTQTLFLRVMDTFMMMMMNININDLWNLYPKVLMFPASQKILKITFPDFSHFYL
jgi:Na+/alanine symporter